VATGPSGSDYSTDEGASWQSFGAEGFHTASFARAALSGAGWAAGENGRIAKYALAGAPPRTN
jgi:hypothetical protein